MSSPNTATLGAHTIHPTAVFEGFYTKFALPSGSTLIVIPCTVPHALDNTRKHLLSFVYIPPPSPSTSSTPAKPWAHEVRPARILREITNKHTGAFTLVCLDDNSQEIATFTSSPEKNTYSIHLSSPPVTFDATVTEPRTPWSSTDSLISPSSPEGALSYLPLPLHWHVHSLSSPTTFTLSLPSEAAQDERDRSGNATAHEEKNWANGFPTAHVWCQARSSTSPSTLRMSPSPISTTHASKRISQSTKTTAKESGITLAGGLTLNLAAFLIGYRHSSPALGQLEIDIRPPFAVGIPWPSGGCLSPFLDFAVDWRARRWWVDCAGWRWRVVVHAEGPGSKTGVGAGTAERVADAEERGEKQDELGWFHFSSPKREGFVERGMAQTVAGKLEVRLLRRRWIWPAWSGYLPKLWEWDEVCEEVFEGAGMEFGGEYYEEYGKRR